MRMRRYLITALWASSAVVPASVHAQTASRPEPARIEGKTTETRPPEKSDNQPTFPQQTRAPYHPSAPFKVTTLIDNLPVTWSIAFLPDGKLLLTERLPGSIRLFDPRGDPRGALSDPVAGVFEGKRGGQRIDAALGRAVRHAVDTAGGDGRDIDDHAPSLCDHGGQHSAAAPERREQ